MPLATDAQGRRDLRQALGDLRGAIDDLLSNEGYMKRHFDAVSVKADSSDFAADIDVSRCVSRRL